MDNTYSLSDLAAVSGGGALGGLGNSGLIILIVLFMMLGGGGWGNRGDFGQYATAASQQEILFGQRFQNLDNKMDRLGNGIADATFALNNAITTEGRNIQNQFAATQAAIHAEGEATRALLQQNKIDALQGQVSQLQLNAALCGVVRYPNATTYTAGASPFCNCGCGSGF